MYHITTMYRPQAIELSMVSTTKNHDPILSSSIDAQRLNERFLDIEAVIEPERKFEGY